MESVKRSFVYDDGNIQVRFYNSFDSFFKFFTYDRFSTYILKLQINVDI